MKKKIILFFLSLALTVPLSGCSYMGEGILSMVKPPQFSEQQFLIYKALEDSIQEGEAIKLVSPQNGNYRSAVIVHTVDNIHSEEAIVFYESSAQNALGESRLRVCLLDQVDGQWKVIWNVPGEGTKVDKVLFLTDNATMDRYIIIGFIPEDKTQNTYNIYTYKDGDFTRVDSGSYQMMELYDIIGDGQEDFITVGYKEEKTLVSADSSGNLTTTLVSAEKLDTLKTTATINKIKDGKLIKQSETNMSGKAIGYENIHKDTTTFGKPALIIDEQINKNTFATEILVYENDRLRNLMLNEKRAIFEQTLRTQIPISYDIDADGRVEIPKTMLFPGYTQNSSSPVYMSVWRKFEENKLTKGIYAYVNYSQGYGLLLPQEWIGRVSAKNIVQNNEIEFFKYKGNIEDDSEKILNLKIDTLGNSKNFPAGCTIIDTVGQVVFLAKVYDIKDEDLTISIDQVKSQLIKMYVISE